MIFFQNKQGSTNLTENELDGIKIKGVTTIHELDILEQENITKALHWLATTNIKNPLSIDFFHRLHFKMYGDVWRWAGKIRHTVKNIGVPINMIMIELIDLIDDTKYWIEHKTYPPIELTARFHHHLVFVHPYANGNGRWARLLTNILCEQNNFPKPTWGANIEKDKRRKIYIDALRAADKRNFKPLTDFLTP